MSMTLIPHTSRDAAEHHDARAPRALHHAPPLPTVAVEQLRLAGLLLRGGGVLLLVLLVLLVLVPVLSVNGAHDAAGRRLAGSTNFTFTPEASIPMVFLALLIPLVVWRDEDPTQREYHWLMPVSRRTHTLLRVFAGWVWTMVATLAYVLAVAVLPSLMQHLTGVSQPYHHGFSAWEWLVPFTATSIAYAYASTAAVGARRPLVWVFGVVAIYAGSILVLLQRGMAERAVTLLAGWNGRLGARVALMGVADTQPGVPPDAGRWLGATALWGGVAIVMLWVVCTWRRDRA
jgi:hypothetical protein